MKQSVLALSALVAAAQAVQPMFTNSAFDVEPNKPFTLTYNADGCASGCTIKLKTGAAGNLADYKEPLATGVTGTSFTVTPLAGWPVGPLAFEISNNQDPHNYSVQFPYAGTGTASPSGDSSSSSAASVPASTMTHGTTSAAPIETDSSTTTEAPVSTGVALVSNSSTSTTALSTAARNGTSSVTTRTGSGRASATTVPSSGFDRVSASLALVAGVAAAMACLN